MNTKLILIITIMIIYSFCIKHLCYAEKLKDDVSTVKQSNSYKWVSIPPIGPEVYDILVKTDDKKTVYLATSKGVFRTKNEGLIWYPSYHGLKLSKVRVLAIDPNASQIIYAGGEGGLFRSSDEGITWENISGGILKDIYFIRIVDSLTLYAVGKDKLYKSLNGGKSWANITLDDSNAIYYFEVNHKSVNEIYLVHGGSGKGNKLFYSNNGGQDWLTIKPDVKVFEDEKKYYAPDWWSMLQIHPLDSKIIIAECGVHGWGGHLVKSTDGGKTWKEITPTRNNIKNMQFPKGRFPQYKGEVIYDLNNKNNLYIIAQEGSFMSYTDVGILKSNDGGETWELLKHNIGKGIEIHSICSPSNTLVFYAGTSKGVYKIINGGKSWKAINVGLPSGGMCKKASLSNVENSNAIYWSRAADEQQGTPVYKTIDGGLSWDKYYNVNYRYPEFDRNIQPTFITTYNKTEYILEPNLIISKESHASDWRRLKNNVPKPLLLTISKSNSQHMYLLGDSESNGTNYISLSISVDGGLSWFTNNTPVKAFNAICMATFLDNNKKIVCIAKDDRVPGRDEIYKTENDGKNWINVSDGLRESIKRSSLKESVDIIITTIAVDPVLPDILFVGTKGSGIHKSTDGGKTWCSIVKGFPNSLEKISISCLEIDPKNTDIIYAGTNTGIFRSFDGGKTWDSFNDNLYDKNVKNIRINNNIPNLVILETDTSIYRLTDTKMTWLTEAWNKIFDKDNDDVLNNNIESSIETRHLTIIKSWRLGIKANNMSPDLANALNTNVIEGALVEGFEEDSPAKEAGVKHNDIIIMFDEKPVKNKNQLKDIVDQTEMGKKINVVVLRDGSEKILTVTVGK